MRVKSQGGALRGGGTAEKKMGGARVVGGERGGKGR